MARRIALAATATLLISSALAEDTPAGWSRDPDGTYVNGATGIRCASDMAGYAFKSLEAAPDSEGVCLYAKDGGESGLLRIRRYAQGVGETSLAIKNDESLMHPETVSQGKLVSTFRGGPGPVVDGTQTYQMVFTFLVKGLLVDCIARHTNKSMPPSEFPLACMKAAGG